jgi:hypothetical protein
MTVGRLLFLPLESAVKTMPQCDIAIGLRLVPLHKVHQARPPLYAAGPAQHSGVGSGLLAAK